MSSSQAAQAGPASRVMAAPAARAWAAKVRKVILALLDWHAGLLLVERPRLHRKRLTGVVVPGLERRLERAVLGRTRSPVAANPAKPPYTTRKVRTEGGPEGQESGRTCRG